MNLVNTNILSPNNYQKVTIHPCEDKGMTEYTFNWCDPTTWYLGATRIVDEVMVDSGDHTTYELEDWTNKMHIVDVYHGKITNEDWLLDAGDNSYRVVVKVNDVEKDEQDPHYGSGGDYTVDYNAGTVTFLSALQDEDVVKITYHKVDRTAGDGSASQWILGTVPGRALEIVKVEVQFSEDVGLTDSVLFQAYVAGNPYGNPDIYKTMWDFYNDANGCYPELPALGGNSWRGATTKAYSFPWLYQAVKRLSSVYSSEVRLCLQHDEPFTGANATATFYCLSVEE